MNLMNEENKIFFYIGVAAIALMVVGTIVCNLAHINFPTKVDASSPDERARQRQDLRDEEDMALFQFGIGLILFNIGIGALIVSMIAIGISGGRDEKSIETVADFLRKLASSLPRAAMVFVGMNLLILWIIIILLNPTMEKIILMHS
ncbi:MAG: hypothetical protein QW728_00785 [Thermoplasmata archaeon]